VVGSRLMYPSQKSPIFFRSRKTEMLSYFVLIFILVGLIVVRKKVSVFLQSCFLFPSVFFWSVGSKMVGSNPWQVRMKLNSKQLRSRFQSQLIVKSIMTVDVSPVSQCGSVTELKPNFRIDHSTLGLRSCFVLILRVVGKHVQIQGSSKVAKGLE